MEKSNIRFSPIKNKRTYEEVSFEIKKMIINGQLKPGDKLPSEIELANQSNVGRQTIREALRILELSGFITVQKGFGGGPIIKDTILSKVSNLLIDAFKMEKITANDFVAARMVIEKAILNEVFDKVTQDDTEALRKNIIEAQEQIKKNELATDINFKFHSILRNKSEIRSSKFELRVSDFPLLLRISQ